MYEFECLTDSYESVNNSAVCYPADCTTGCVPMEDSCFPDSSYADK